MLEHLNIDPELLREIVADAKSDDDVARYVREHATPGAAETWNEHILGREVYGGNRAEAIAEHPWLADHPEIVKSLDFLQYMEDNGLDDA
jgi:hypothetical protein